jgi:hypothetical protein
MRKTLVPGVCLLVALSGAPMNAQHPLPARTFEPSLPAVAPLPTPPVAEWWRGGGPRIRPRGDRVVNAFRIGTERSSLFRTLVHRIENSDVVVYAGVDPRMARGLLGRLTFTNVAGGYRYLRIMLNPELGADAMAAALGHELRHVVEIIESPDVVSEATLEGLYARIGRSNRAGGIPGWETDSALNTGLQVRRELNLGAVLAQNRAEPRDERR